VRVDGLELGAVVRAAETWTGVGGKAVNVARFAAALGAAVKLLVVGDDALLAAIEADPVLSDPAGGESIAVRAVRSPIPSRTDVTLVGTGGTVTVVNGTAAPPGNDALAALPAATCAAIAPGDVLVLAGSTPVGTADAYRELAEAGRDRGARVLVDASGVSLRAALEGGPWGVKVNASEAAEASLGPEAASLVAVTDGPRGLRAWLPDGRVVRILPPGGLEVVSSLGAGDAVTAGLAVRLAAGGSALDGLVLGTAMAAASLRHLEVRADPDDVRALLPRVVVEAAA
jgi:1-phosphofructokinase